MHHPSIQFSVPMDAIRHFSSISLIISQSVFISLTQEPHHPRPPMPGYPRGHVTAVLSGAGTPRHGPRPAALPPHRADVPAGRRRRGAVTPPLPPPCLRR